MATLYAISDALLACLAEDENGELPADAAERLDALEGELLHKAENICRYVQQCKADSEAYTMEAKRLQMLATKATNKADRLKDYLMEVMERHQFKNLDTELFNLRIQKNSQPSVILRDGCPVPEKFQRIEVSLDKKAVIAAAKSGDQLPPELSLSIGSHLRIA